MPTIDATDLLVQIIQSPADSVGIRKILDSPRTVLLPLKFMKGFSSDDLKMFVYDC